MNPLIVMCKVLLMYATRRCNPMSQSQLDLVTLDAKDCVALSKSHLAIRAANNIFMRTLLAMGCNRPAFSFSSRGLAAR